MDSPQQALTRRIRELRRKHFGPRGATAFAQRLGLSPEEYARYERGAIPPADVMVRICETTGEDLQWLLTGVSARGTVVISGTRSRHQDLLARLARMLDERPELAAPVEAFVDLLAQGPSDRSRQTVELAAPPTGPLIPVFDADAVPPSLPGGGPGEVFELAPLQTSLDTAQHESVDLAEPAMSYPADATRQAELLTFPVAHGGTRQFVHSVEIGRCFPSAFGVRLTSDLMRPMFSAGDAVLVAPGIEAKVGRPALCRLADEPEARCRIWLGCDDDMVQLGRLSDGECEQVPRSRLLWSLEILYRVARAA